jgi:hypothetical protein
MANTIIPLNTTTVTNITTLIDKPSTGTTPLTSTDLKKLFDKTGADLKTWINGTLNEEITKNSIPFAVGSVDLAGNSITATITGIDTLVNGMAVAIEITETAYSVTDTAITLNINSLGAFEICYIRNLVDATTLAKAKRIAATSIFTVRYNAAQSIWIVQ